MCFFVLDSFFCVVSVCFYGFSFVFVFVVFGRVRFARVWGRVVLRCCVFGVFFLVTGCALRLRTAFSQRLNMVAGLFVQ